MLNLLKHLKPFVASMILAIALLFVQAICDLSLPDYMSNIVNVGNTTRWSRKCCS